MGSPASIAENDFGYSFTQRFLEALCNSMPHGWYVLLGKIKQKQLACPLPAYKSYLLSQALCP